MIAYMNEGTLFERLGGKDAVRTAVDLFYDKILADEHINRFFKDTDMAKQRAHQTKFLTYAFGGLPNYPGNNMRNAHKQLVEEEGLNDSHFDAVAENLQSTLEDMSVNADLIAEVMSIVSFTRNDVLNK